MMQIVTKQRVYELSDRDISLSHELRRLKRDPEHSKAIETVLETIADFKPFIKQFIALVSEHITTPGSLTVSESSEFLTKAAALAPPQAEMMKKMAIFLEGSHPKLLQQYFLEPTARHIIAYVPDEALALVIEFLQLPCPDESSTRNDNMFNEWPELMQSCKTLSDLKQRILDSRWHSYIDFAQRLTKEQTQQILKAAIRLKIVPLQTLVSIRIAEMLCMLTECDIRRIFEVPESARDPVRERLVSVIEPYRTTSQ